MRFWIASGMLLVGWGLSKITGISATDGLVIALLVVTAYMAEKFLTVYAVSAVVLDKKIVTKDDFESYLKKE